jgi:hypothetical protein
MSRILPAKEILDIQDAAPVRIQRTDAFVDFSTKGRQLFDMRKQLLADLFLIGIRQARKLCDGLFERIDHGRSLAHFCVARLRNSEQKNDLHERAGRTAAKAAGWPDEAHRDADEMKRLPCGSCLPAWIN